MINETIIENYRKWHENLSMAWIDYQNDVGEHGSYI